MVIPALTSVIFQLRDRGRLKLTDPVTRWLPSLPDGDEVTIMMLLNNSSGYQDWIQKNEAFVEALCADPFRTWKEDELLRIALDRGSICDPGTCFNGYMGHMAWLPKRRLAIGLVTTAGRTTPPDDPTNYSGTIMRDIAAYLTPSHIPAIWATSGRA